MSKEKYKWGVESCVNEIWQQCCVRSTTRQKIYIEKCVDRLLKQIREELKENQQVFSVTLYDDENVIEPVKAVSSERIEKVLSRYLNEKQ